MYEKMQAFNVYTTRIFNVHITGTCTKAMDALFQNDIHQDIMNSRMCVYFK